MNTFVEIPATKTSLCLRRLVYGVGSNDSNYKTEIIINNTRVQCPFYRRWVSMLSRCYSKSYQERFPTYKGCSVCDEWLLFSAFKAWMISKDWIGLELDKDLRVKGNKIYSPETCIFISGKDNKPAFPVINKDNGLPEGVTYNDGRYRARCRHNGSRISLGSYLTSVEASNAYVKFKLSI